MENTKIWTPAIDTSFSHDVTEEFSLPDYVPAVERIVLCKSEVLPESRAMRDGEVTLSGIVTYQVTYIGDDGALSCAPLNSEYTARLPVATEAEAMSGAELGVSTYVEHVTCRATAPRRLNVTCRMRSNVFGTKSCELAEELSAEDDEVSPGDMLQVRNRKKEAVSSSVVYATYTGGISGELRERDGMKPVSCDGGVGVIDVRYDSGAAVVRGEVYITCLMLNGDGTYSSVRTRAPFEERIPVSLPEGGSVTPSARGRCASVNIRGGEDGVFLWEAEYDIDVTLARTVSSEISFDAYSTGYESTAEFETNLCCTGVRNMQTRMSVSGDTKLKCEEKTPVAAYGRAVCESCESDGEGRLSFRGTCTVSVILVGDGDALCEEALLPFTYKCSVGDISSYKLNGVCTASVLYCDARLDGDKLVCEAELCLEAMIVATGEVTYLKRLVLNKEKRAQHDGSRVTVFFPYPEETMWDTCKLFMCEEKNITKSASGNALIITR